MEHHFNIDIAQKYGVDEAIMLNHIIFWVLRNEANEKNLYEGYYWTFNSVNAFEKLFPYWSRRQIDRVLKSLESKSLILTGNFNKSSYDRTKWYTLSNLTRTELLKPCNYLDNSISQNGEMEKAEWGNGNNQTVKPIPYINKDNKTQLKNTNKKEKEKGINVLIESYTESNDLRECIKDFIKMRAAIKKPLTDRALKILLDKLDKLESTEDRKIKVLEQSIVNSWQGIFELKEEVTKHVIKSTSSNDDPLDF